MKKTYTFLAIMLFVSISNLSVAQQSQGFTKLFLTTDINSSFAIIDTVYTNNKPNINPIYTHNYNPGGGFGIFQDYKQGMWYHAGEWRILNQDNSDFDKNVTYNILAPGTDTKTWKHTADAASITANQTELDDISINGDPNALIFVSDVLEGVYNTNIIGVYYKTSNSRWYIFNEAGSGTPMKLDAKFNIVLPNKNNTSFNTLALKADAQNTSTYKMEIDHADLNNNPNAIIFVTQVYNINGNVSGTYNNHNVGVLYENGKWKVFNEDQAAMPMGAGFNILYYNNTSIGIKDNKLAKGAVNVYPNPVAANGQLTLNLSNNLSGEVSVKLYNLSGIAVVETSFEKTSGASQNTINLLNVASGMYVLQVENNGKIHTQKLLVE